MSNPFDYVTAILTNKKKLIVDDITEKEYKPFLVNRSLSYHKDCVLFANEMNLRHFVGSKLQFDFLLNTIRSQKRPFVGWAKPKLIDDLMIIKEYFGFSDSKAREALRLLDDEKIKEIKEKIDIGGIKK